MKNDYVQRYQFSQIQKSVQDRNGNKFDIESAGNGKDKVI